MKACEKLREYLVENGIRFAIFAEKIGMTRQHFYQVLQRKETFPPNFWQSIIYYSRNAIELEDLMIDLLQHNPEFRIYGDPSEEDSIIIYLEPLDSGEQKKASTKKQQKSLLRKENVAILENTEA